MADLESGLYPEPVCGCEPGSVFAVVKPERSKKEKINYLLNQK